jgi:hypothetical protein
MASRKSYSHSFAGGEMSPMMHGHIEDEGYRTGFARGREMIILPTGALTKRPQFEFVHACKSGASSARLFPFVYGDGDAYAMEWGTNHVRFHSNGSTLLYATPIPVASVDLSTDRFTTSSAHGLAVNDAVRITHKGTSIPGNLATGSTYYVRDVVSSTVFTLSASAGPGAPLLDLTTNSTIDETSFWKQSGLPREYVQARTVVRNGNQLDASAAHGLVVTHGDAVHFTTTGTLPSPLAVGTVYYTRYVDADSFTVFPTKKDALANTNQITLTSAGAGTHTFHYAYYQGDVVWGGSLTILASTSSRAFIAIDDLPTALPTVSNWHQMPADGAYEIYTVLGAAALADLNYDQSLDVWTLVKPQSAAYTLSRESVDAPSGSSTSSSYTKFVFRRVDPSPGPPAPTLTLGSRVFGQYYNVTFSAATPTVGTAATTGAVPHTLLPGDVVYLEASVGSGLAVGSISGTPGFFLVTDIPAPNTFRLRTIVGGAEVGAGGPTSGAIRVIGSSGQLTSTYVVTAIRDGDESTASTPLTVTNALDVPGSSNVLAWTAVTGAQRYRLYKLLDGAYGLVIETSLLTATDDGIGPDLGVQPPTYDSGLDTEYPRAVANFQQRGWFGGSDTNPRRVWGGKTGTVSTMSYHENLILDTDRIRLDMAARERTLVRHIVPASQLWVMTSAAEIRLTGINNDVLTPTSLDARPLSHVGCTIVRPIVANSNILFVGARDQHVYELPSQTYQIVDPPDLSVRSAHLFDGFELMQSAQQRSPVPIEWYVRDDGALLGMTYMPAQNIRGWHVHTTAGTDASIESVCVIPDSDGDRLYAIVSRTINSATVLHVERMGRIETPDTMTACKYLDSCVTYSGPAVTSIPVAHLPGQVVYAVADGVVRGPFTVSTGASPTITLASAASTVHVGLLYTPELRPMPPSVMIDGYGKGRELNVNRVSFRVADSCTFKVAAYQDDDAERGVVRTAWAVPGLDNTRMRTKDVEASVNGPWGRAQVVVTQDVPLPLTIVSMTVDVELGGP